MPESGERRQAWARWHAIAASAVASWFETREDALLTMRVQDLS